MSDPELNPFAPPRTTDTGGGPSAPGDVSADATQDPAALQAALERLDRHLADAGAARADEVLAGDHFRVRTFVSAGVFLVSAALAAFGFAQRSMAEVAIIGTILATVGFIFALAFLIQDVRLVARAEAREPADALKAFFRALQSGRPGYALASLCPDARDATIAVPEMAPVETDHGRFAMNEPRSIRDWARGWAVAGRGQVRWMGLKGMELVGASGRVARVRATIQFQSWPQWANAVSVVLFVVIRLVGIIVALVLYYSLRRRATVTTTKTLLQGSNGQWYLYTADLYDAAR